MSQYDAEDLELIEGFREESNDHLEVMETQLLELENGEFDLESINVIFRSIHTIKGGSGFLGFQAVKDLSHKMESLLDLLRNSKIDLTSDITDVLLCGTDLLKEMFEDLENQEQVLIDKEMDLLDRLMNCESKQVDTTPKEVPFNQGTKLKAMKGLEWADIQGLIKKGFHFNGLIIRKSDHEKNVAESGFELFSEYFNSFGKLVAHEGLEDDTSKEARIAFGSVLEGEFASASLCVAEDDLIPLSEEDMKAYFSESEPKAEPEKPVQKEEKKPVQKEEKKAPVKKNQKTNTGSQSLKVSTQLLGKLMTLTGELILCRNQLVQELPSTDMPALHTLNQRLSELQETVMKTRLQPVGSVFNKVPRMVRDLSRSLDKIVEVELSGVEVELDRTIIDAINDPLTHLVRNSIDHGFEDKAARAEAGKPSACQLSLRAFHEGGLVNLEIKDDGRGIDVNKLKKKAIENGLITGSEAETMGQREALGLIFRPGFSMAKEVTEISGRGVGMDVVKTSFEKLGGTVDLFSELGVGTTVLVKLPTTLAIVSAIIAQVENYSFAISQGNIEEIVRLKEGEISEKLERIGSFEVLRLRGQLLPVVRLADVFQIPRTYMDESGSTQGDRRRNMSDRRGLGAPTKQELEMRSGADRRKRGRTHYIVVVRVGLNQFGILINKIQNTEEIVIKPLSSFIDDLDCFHGSTIRGDGQVIMILDCNGLAKTAKLKFAELEDLEAKGRLGQDGHVTEMQSFLVFKNHTKEHFAMPLPFITRIEKVFEKDIVMIGGKEFIHLAGKNVPLFRLEQKLSVTEGSRNADGTFYLLIPCLVKSPYALVCSKVLDVVTTEIELETDVMPVEGVLGTCILNGKTTVILDIYGLFEEHREADTFIQSENKILLVEDTPFFMNMISTYLKQGGFMVDEAVNGVKAMQMLEKESYDLVLSDIEMPEMDGYELVHKIKMDPRFHHLPVMAITALDNPSSKAKGKKAGFDAYQVKLDKTELISAIKKLITISKGVE